MILQNNKGLDESLALALTGKTDESEKLLLSLDSNDPRVRFNLGWHAMRNGNLYLGHQYIESGRDIDVFGGAKNPLVPKWNGQSLKDKTLLFHGEGGFGDEFINIRFVKNFYEMGAKVIVGCSRELFCIFERIPYITALVDRNVCIHSHHHTWIPSMSAPLYLKTEYSDLDGAPYLNYFNKKWVPKNSAKLKIGIRWAGSPRFEHQQHRKFPVEKMFDLTKIEGATYYSLQRDDDLVDNIPCIDLRYEMKTWKDTAEIIQTMDLIITSCTSVAHLSAAMGKPTWVIVPVLPYYIWTIPTHTSPWYNSVKLYRQTKYENWDEPFEKITCDLKKFIYDNIKEI